MKRVLLLALFALPAYAADDPQTQIALLQAALGVCQQQRNEAQDATLNKVTPLVIEVERLRAQVKELQDKAKK